MLIKEGADQTANQKWITSKNLYTLSFTGVLTGFIVSNIISYHIHILRHPLFLPHNPCQHLPHNQAQSGYMLAPPNRERLSWHSAFSGVNIFCASSHAFF